MAGLFGTFNIGKSGLFAQQRAIDITSHNISNANTEGYSRQRVQLQASKPANEQVGPGQIGTGVDVVSIDRIRDAFLDYQARNELGIQGQFTSRDKFLSQVENVFNEPTDNGMSKLIGNFFDTWSKLGTNTTTKTQISQSAVEVTNYLNHSYYQLEKIKSDTQDIIQNSVADVNKELKQLNSINQQIINVNVSGNNPNDLKDQRDVILDKLSSSFGITIDKKQYEGNNVTTTNDVNNPNSDSTDDGRPPLAADGKASLNLVQSEKPDEASRFSYINTITPTGTPTATEADYKVTYYKNGDTTLDANKVTITVKITGTDAADVASKYKKLNECRVLWANNNGTAYTVDRTTNSQGQVDGTASEGTSVDYNKLALFQPPTGEFKGYMSVQTDVNSYEDQLNQFAKAIAFSVNGVMSQSATAVADGTNNINNLFINGDKKDDYTDATKVAGAEQELTAGNITVNNILIDSPELIKTQAQYDDNGKGLSGEKDVTRATAISMIRDRLMNITGIDSNTKMDKSDYLNTIFVQNSNVGTTPIYTIKNTDGGKTLDTCYKDIVGKVGMQEQTATKMISNQATVVAGIQQRRDSVSGVSLDEEMANLVQFQHCYQANAKVISTIDQLLDVVVNGLKK